MGQFNLDDIDIYRILSSMHEGVLISDTAGTIRFFNKTQAEIDDIDPENAIGKKITDIYQLKDKTSPTMRCLKNGRPIINETMIYRTQLGKVANVLNNVYPLYKSGNLIGAINFSKDYQFLEKIIVQDSTSSAKTKSGNYARFHFSDIVGSDSGLQNAIQIAKLSSSSPSPIMICGETGTGKELFAQSIHNHSSRKKRPFIPINCAAIPENLLEGILFGTSKGSFTGAINKSGLFEQAHGGSIFLDELGSMPLPLQAKLLRVMQEKKIRRLGSLKEIDLDVKILSSVGEPPLEIVKKKVLRMDLFYRMGVVVIMLPPLRERKNELDALIRFFITKHNQLLNIEVSGVSKNVLNWLSNYHWPGNIRELEHIIEASMNMVAGDDTIRLGHLPAHIIPLIKNRISPIEKQSLPKVSLHSTKTSLNTPSTSLNLIDKQAANEKQMISEALKKNSGNAAKAARSLGISPQSLYYKLKKFKVRAQDYSI